MKDCTGMRTDSAYHKFKDTKSRTEGKGVDKCVHITRQCIRCGVEKQVEMYPNLLMDIFSI